MEPDLTALLRRQHQRAPQHDMLSYTALDRNISINTLAQVFVLIHNNLYSGAVLLLWFVGWC